MEDIGEWKAAKEEKMNGSEGQPENWYETSSY